jgi:hypothetical protein
MQGELKNMEKPYTSLLSYVAVYPQCCSFLYLMSSSNDKSEVPFIPESCSRDVRRRRRRRRRAWRRGLLSVVTSNKEDMSQITTAK